MYQGNAAIKDQHNQKEVLDSITTESDPDSPQSELRASGHSELPFVQKTRKDFERNRAPRMRHLIDRKLKVVAKQTSVAAKYNDIFEKPHFHAAGGVIIRYELPCYLVSVTLRMLAACH